MAKKPSSKKPVSKAGAKKPKAKSAPAKAAKTKRDELASQLAKLIRELNEEGLAFLVKQALILKHNQQVDEINFRVSKAAPSEKKEEKREKKPARPGSDKYSIEIVEAKDGSHFILAVNNSRNFFARDEMKKIVKICHASADVRDAAARLYNWFTGERIDVINNTGITGTGDPALATIYNAIMERYTVKE